MQHWETRRHLLADWQIDLIEKACASHDVSDVEWGPRTLRYLAVYSEPRDRDHRGSRALKEQVLNRSAHVPMKIKDLQRRLDKYFDNEGSTSERRIAINFSESRGPRRSDQYAISYPFNHGRGACRQFWRDYMRSGISTLLCYGKPLFTDDERHQKFSRDVRINEEHDLEDSASACYPFVTLGEVIALWKLSDWFGEPSNGNVPVIRRGYSRKDSSGDALEEFSDANGVLLGATRVNGVLRDYLQDRLFRYSLDDLEFCEHEDGFGSPVVHRFGDSIVVRGKHVKTHVLISRMPGKDKRVVTMIAANSGRAIERMATLLTNEEEISQLLNDHRVKELGDPLPPVFQLLFEVDVYDRDSRAGKYNLIKAWAPTDLRPL